MVASKANELARLTTLPRNKSLTLRVEFTSENENVSPVMDLQNATFVLGRNKSNQPVDDYVNDSRTNQIENDPHGAVFVTKAISLGQEATSLRVIIAAIDQKALISESSINCSDQIPQKFLKSLYHSQVTII